MRVVVQHHHRFGADAQEAFQGDEAEVREALLAAFPWLRHRLGPHAAVAALVARLNQTQAYTVRTGGTDILLKSADDGVVAAQLGHDAGLEAAFAAARFLAAGAAATPEARRRALFQAHGDVLEAALLAHGLAPTAEHRAALEAVLGASALCKAEAAALPQEAVAVTEDGAAFAAAVQRALRAGGVEAVRLGGKHSAGSLVAVDPEDQRHYLLKPGAGKQPPALGAADSSASQSKREAAFWAVADAWGLGKDLPEAHLLLLDGREYAAMTLLGSGYQTALQAQQHDPGYVRRLFQMRRPEGQLHRWAVLDYVLGNSDRHAQNVMVRGPEVQLIDHGSTMAGKEFDPAVDRYTFVPFYLRALAPPDFAEQPPEYQLRHLPRLSTPAAAALRAWLEGLDADALAATLHRHGIEAAPAVNRLRLLRLSLEQAPADLAVLQAWVLP